MVMGRVAVSVGSSTRSTVLLGRVATTPTTIRHTTAPVRIPGNVLSGLGGIANLQTSLAPIHLDLIVDLPQRRGGILRKLVGDKGTTAVGAVVPMTDDGHVGQGSVAGEDGDEVGLVGRAGDLADEELDIGAAGLLLVLVLASLDVGGWTLALTLDGWVGIGIGSFAIGGGGTTDAVQHGTLIGRRHDGDGGGGVGLVHLHDGRLVGRRADNDGRAVLPGGGHTGLLGHLHDVAEGDAPRGARAGSRGGRGADDDPVRIRGDGIGAGTGSGIGRDGTGKSTGSSSSHGRAVQDCPDGHHGILRQSELTGSGSGRSCSWVARLGRHAVIARNADHRGNYCTNSRSRSRSGSSVRHDGRGSLGRCRRLGRFGRGYCCSLRRTFGRRLRLRGWAVTGGGGIGISSRSHRRGRRILRPVR